MARKIEELGIPTIYIGSCRTMMAQVKPPRSVFVNFPLGRQCGKPNDVDLQTRILKDALHVLVSASTPGEIVDLTHEWGEPFDFSGYRQDIEEMLQEENSAAQVWNPSE